MKRTILAGLAAGVAMYVWSSIAHVVTPLGQVGVGVIPNEQPVLDALHSSLGASTGLYMYPGMDLSSPASMQAQMDIYEKKLATNPSGLLIYNPPGAKPMETSQLITEFVIELIESMLLVFLLSATSLVTFGARVGFATVVGIVGSMVTNLPYWNWYHFPTNYTACSMFVQIVGFVVAGAVAALILKKPV